MEQPMRLEGRVDELAKRLAGVETELWILTEGTLDDRDSMLERVDRIARLDAELAQLDRNLQAEVVARVKAHCTCTHEKRMHANALNGCLVSGCRCEKYTGEGSTSQTGAVSHSQSGGGSDGTREPARSARIDDAGTTQDTPSPASPVKPCPDVPFGSLGNDVEETLDALLGFGRSARMVERAQLRNEIAGLLARRTPAPSPAYTEPTAKECLAVYAEEPDAPGIAEAPDGTLPCVYCSNENLCVEIRKHPGMLGFSVRCGSATTFCGARGPVRPAQMDAVEEWNRAYRWVHPPKGDAPKPASEAALELTPDTRIDNAAFRTASLEVVRRKFWELWAVDSGAVQMALVDAWEIVEPSLRQMDDMAQAKGPASEAQGEPTLEECQSAYWLAHNAHESSDQPVLYAINAVRDLCISRAPSHSGPGSLSRKVEDGVDAPDTGPDHYPSVEQVAFAIWDSDPMPNDVRMKTAKKVRDLFVTWSRAPSPSPALAAPSFEDVERAYDNAKEWDGRSWSREAGLRAVMALYTRAALGGGS